MVVSKVKPKTIESQIQAAAADTLVLNQRSGHDWHLYHGDCIEVMKGLPDDSIDMVVTSIPFLSLFVYSASDHDFGNVKSDGEFYEGYYHFSKELIRIMKPGCIASIHSMIMPSSKERDGYIGLKDFPGEVRRIMVECGFIFHSEVVIRKDPVAAMQRTKALGLLHKQIVKNSAMSRQGIPDYLTSFRKPGDRVVPVAGMLEYYAGTKTAVTTASKTAARNSIDTWQNYAEPVFTDISSRFAEVLPTLNPEQSELFYQLLNYRAAGTTQEQWVDIDMGKTLQYQSARDNNDERHCCPLQLQVIERALQLWTNSGDVVLDPFNGIGSTGWQALKMGRKYLGIELKESYFNAAANNLDGVSGIQQMSILGSIAL
jgi:DNA modification methylase